MLGIIGGSGLDQLPILGRARRRAARTPYGKPSGALLIGQLGGARVAFLPRHGERHTLAPHEVNYRANLWALHRVGVERLVGVASVGGIRADLEPGTLVIPDQIIDYTHGRAGTWRLRSGKPVTHIDFTRPYCEALRQRLLQAARDVEEPAVDGGTYAATQGPRLETAAEITRLERDGADLVGMTGMPETALAREIGICYAAMAVVVNPAAGRGSSSAGIDAARMARVLSGGMVRVLRILSRLAETDGD